MKPYYIYIVKCFDGSFYIGKTNDLEKRLKEHNGILPKGAKYTRSRRPVSLIYYEECLSNTLALQREYTLKQLTRKQKEDLIFKFQIENREGLVYKC